MDITKVFIEIYIPTRGLQKSRILYNLVNNDQKKKKKEKIYPFSWMCGGIALWF